MRARTTIAVLAGAGALAAGVTANVGAQGQGQGADRTIVLYEKNDEGAFKFVDAKPFTRLDRRGPRRISTGDAFFIRGPFYSEPTSAERAATGRGHCRATNPSRRFSRITFMCDGNIAFADGGIDFHGLLRDPEGSVVFAVTGGTRAYEGARGQVTLEEQQGGDKITIHLLADK